MEWLHFHLPASLEQQFTGKCQWDNETWIGHYLVQNNFSVFPSLIIILWWCPLSNTTSAITAKCTFILGDYAMIELGAKREVIIFYVFAALWFVWSSLLYVSLSLSELTPLLFWNCELTRRVKENRSTVTKRREEHIAPRPGIQLFSKRRKREANKRKGFPLTRIKEKGNLTLDDWFGVGMSRRPLRELGEDVFEVSATWSGHFKEFGRE